jgi:hypothetical protein
MKGYKAFNDKFQCTSEGKIFQYEVGKTYEEPTADLHISGFHFCENPLDTLRYYPPTGKFAEVEAENVSDKTSDDSKRVSSRLKISSELSLPALCGLGVKFILDKVDFKNAPATNTGNYSAATNTGDQSAATNTGDQSAATNTGGRSAATNTGYRSAATNTGYQSAATNTGDQSAATNTGTQSAATNTGYRSAATNTGDQSAATNTGNRSAATNTGDQSAATNTGKNGWAFSVGFEGKAKGAVGCWITLAEWKNGEPIDTQTLRVDGFVIKADTFYQLRGGKFTECIE